MGVAVPESGYAGDGNAEASVIEESMPERIAMPRVPARILRQLRTLSDDGARTSSKAKETLTTTEHGKRH